MNGLSQPILVGATLVVVAGLVPGAAAAQSLPEIARELVRQRENAPQATRVFTNENIGQVGRNLAASSRTIAPTVTAPSVRADEADSATPEIEPAEETVGGRTESEWREAFADAREEAERAEDLRALAQQELETLNQRLLTESGLYNREAELGPQITQKREEVSAAQARVEEAIDALAALQTELRTAGGPPGWAR